MARRNTGVEHAGKATVAGLVMAGLLMATAPMGPSAWAWETSGVTGREAAAGRGAASAPSVLFGVTTPPGPSDLRSLDAFEAAAGKRVGLFMYYQGWAYHPFDPSAASAVAARGAIPMITWEPWDYLKGTRQPAYTLGSIIRGAHDAYIRSYARGAAAWGQPVMIRFAHEMNGDWYPWSEKVNGNRPGQFVKAWRRVVNIFRAEGAHNVSWVWAPNVSYAGTIPLSRLYPGDDYVDWVGLDGYNGGTELPWGGWLTFEQIFASTLSEVRGITTAKPVMISEVASVEGGGSKARWITEFFASMGSRSYVKAFVWFNHQKEADWRVQSSPGATAAFSAGVADARYG